jgi:transcriptional regulator with XRE-family HTH domain
MNGVQLSQTQIGKMFGTGQSNIFKYESCMSTVPAKVMLQYADCFDISKDYLYSRINDTHRKCYTCRIPEVEKTYSEIDSSLKPTLSLELP